MLAPRESDVQDWSYGKDNLSGDDRMNLRDTVDREVNMQEKGSPTGFGRMIT